MYILSSFGINCFCGADDIVQGYSVVPNCFLKVKQLKINFFSLKLENWIEYFGQICSQYTDSIQKSKESGENVPEITEKMARYCQDLSSEISKIKKSGKNVEKWSEELSRLSSEGFKSFDSLEFQEVMKTFVREVVIPQVAV